MKTLGALLPVTLLGVLLVLAVWWLGRGPELVPADPERAAPSQPSAESLRAASGAQRRTPAEPAPAGSVPPAPHPGANDLATVVGRAEDDTGAPGSGQLTLRVVDTRGLPIPGARVWFGATMGGGDGELDETWRGAVAVAETATDGSGRATIERRFPDLFDVDTGPLTILAGGFAGWERRGVSVRAGARTDLGDITLHPARHISGRVVDATGQGIGDAAVWALPFHQLAGAGTFTPLPGAAPDWATRTDPDGRFTLAIVPGDHAALIASHPGYEPNAESVALREGDDFVVTLRSGTRVAGRVLLDGRPVAGARVSGSSVNLLRMETTTDARGGFVLPPVHGETLIWAALESPKAEGWVTVTPPAGTPSLAVEIALELEAEDEPDPEMVTLTGQVVDAETGRPLPAFVVAMEIGDLDIGEVQAVRDRVDGTFAFPVWIEAPRTVRVWARARGRQLVRSAPIAVRAGETPPPLRIALPRGGRTVHGHVRDPDGRPLPGVRVVPTGSATPEVPIEWALWNPVWTGADGSFTLGFWDGGPLRLWFDGHAVGHGRALRELTDGSDPLTVTLSPIAGLRGRILRANGHPAVGEPIVVVDDADSDARWAATTDGDGAFEILGMPPGTYRAGRQGNIFGGPPLDPFAVTIEAGAVRTVTHTLAARATLRGRITQAGAPVPGVDLTLRQPGGQWLATATSDDDGCYELAGIAPGRYALQVTPQGGVSITTAPFDCPADVVTQRDAEIPGGTLRIRLRGPDGAPAAVGVQLTIRFDTGAVVATPDRDGTVRLVGVPAGTARLSLPDWSGWPGWTDTCECTGGDDAREFTLPPAKARGGR